MAVLLLQAAGAALGGLFGPVGAAIGTAAGALAGYAIDRALIDGTRRIEGPRLCRARGHSTAEEGVPIPRLYGTARLGGIMIWATRFEEVSTTRRQGGKGGGPKVTEYSYFGNVAVRAVRGRNRGRAPRLGRRARDSTSPRSRCGCTRGGADQAPDPLISAKQGAATRRPIAASPMWCSSACRWTTMATAFRNSSSRCCGRSANFATRSGPWRSSRARPNTGFDPALVTKRARPGEEAAENRHVLLGDTDLAASLDELADAVPEPRAMSRWSFHGSAMICAPAIADPARRDHGGGWRLLRSPGSFPAWNAPTPWSSRPMAAAPPMAARRPTRPSSPRSREIKARGLKVTLYPFMMMDVVPGNGLPDPYGGAAQAAYPWRGRVTCFPGPSQPGTADKTAAARAQIQAFCGTAVSGAFFDRGRYGRVQRAGRRLGISAPDTPLRASRARGRRRRRFPGRVGDCAG